MTPTNTRAGYRGGGEAAFRVRVEGARDFVVRLPGFAARRDPRLAGDGSPADGDLFDEGGPLSKITALRPKDYGEDPRHRWSAYARAHP